MVFERIIKDIVNLLNANDISYMIIGGQAVLRYGNPRLTEDIDITLGISPKESNKLLSVLDNKKY